MSRKNIETIVRNKIQPYKLTESGSAAISLLVKRYPYELLLECIDIGVSLYFKYDETGKLTKESVNKFLDKLGGIAYNKSLPPVEQEINHIKYKGKSTIECWNFSESDIWLRVYISELELLGWSESKILRHLREKYIHMIECCNDWDEWCNVMNDCIKHCKDKRNNDNVTIEQLGTVVPEPLFDKLSPNIQSLCRQINASYENNLYDCTAVIMRRLLEGLLVMSYQENKIEADITDKNGDHHVTLDRMIKNAMQNQTLKLSANTKNDMALFNDLGNYSAHAIWYNCTKNDIQPHILKYRAIIEELMYKAGLK